MLASIAHIKIIRTKYSFFVFMIFSLKSKNCTGNGKKSRKNTMIRNKKVSRSYITSTEHPAKPSIYNDRKLWTEYYQNWSRFFVVVVVVFSSFFICWLFSFTISVRSGHFFFFFCIFVFPLRISYVFFIFLLL